jgi:hypothetical protein
LYIFLNKMKATMAMIQEIKETNWCICRIKTFQAIMKGMLMNVENFLDLMFYWHWWQYSFMMCEVKVSFRQIYFIIFFSVFIWYSFMTLNISYWCSFSGNISDDISGSGLLYLKLELIFCICPHPCY